LPPPPPPPLFPYTTLFRSVLLRHLEHAFLDERHHAARVRRVVAAREVMPCRIESRHVAAARQHARHAGHDARAGRARNIRQAERDRKSTRLNSSHVKISYA